MTDGALNGLMALFSLQVRTERVALRVPTDEDLVGLCRLAQQGIHPPEVMPFAVPWTDRTGERFTRSFLQYHWKVRSAWSPEEWNLEFGVWHDGELVGSQGLSSTNFAVTRCVGTGSWLGQAFQGQGIGKEMRRAVLALAFSGLGANEAHSDAFHDNPASQRVSAALGYEPNGCFRSCAGLVSVPYRMPTA